MQMKLNGSGVWWFAMTIRYFTNNCTQFVWSLVLSYFDVWLIFLIAVSIVAIGILSVILILYSCIKELKNLHGKCIIGFLLSLILACIYARVGYIDSHIKDVLINFALIFAVLWINVLIFDVWWTLRYFHRNFKLNSLFSFSLQLLRFIVRWNVLVLLLLRTRFCCSCFRCIASLHEFPSHFLRFPSAVHVVESVLLCICCCENLRNDWRSNRFWT